MTTPRIIPASALRPGLATIVVSLPGRTIRSRVFMVELRPHGVVNVAFTSGDMITLSVRDHGRQHRASGPTATTARTSARSQRFPERSGDL